MEGWIRLSRKIQEHWIWKDPVKLKWWIDILVTVNHSDTKVNIGMELYECKRGQSVMSLSNWAKRWGASKDSTRNFLNLLQKDGMILHENLVKTTRITVCNYDSYQTDLHDRQTTSKRQANAIRTQAERNTDTNKNDKNDKNDKEDMQLQVGKTWRNDFETYLSEAKEAFLKYTGDEEWISKRKKYNQNLDIKLSIEKACEDYWFTEEGWINKKAKRKTVNINWGTTFANSISLNSNRVYEQKTSTATLFDRKPPHLSYFDEWKDGVRTHRGIPVPLDAPPCPDNNHRWSTIHNKWTIHQFD